MGHMLMSFPTDDLYRFSFLDISFLKYSEECIKDVLFLVYKMEPAQSSTILKFLHFFPASLQAEWAEISKSLMIRLVPSFKLKTKHL